MSRFSSIAVRARAAAWYPRWKRIMFVISSSSETPCVEARCWVRESRTRWAVRLEAFCSARSLPIFEISAVQSVIGFVPLELRWPAIASAMLLSPAVPEPATIVDGPVRPAPSASVAAVVPPARKKAGVPCWALTWLTSRLATVSSIVR